MRKSIKQTIFLCILGVSISSCLSDKINGNENVISQDRNTNGTYTKIVAQQGLSVYITMDTHEKITVEADENLQKLIQTEISNGTLKLYATKDIGTAKAKNIHISVPKIKAIHASSGARVISENTLIGDELNVHAGSGSYIDIQISSDAVHSNSSSGASIQLKGKTIRHNASASSGSSIKGYNLKATEVLTTVSSGANVQVHANEKLNAKASSGGHIYYHGNPKIVEKKKSSGGNISAK